MCGMVGMMGGGVQRVDIEALKGLAHIGALRGTHSTGVVQGHVDYGKSPKISYMMEKSADDIIQYLWYHENDPQGNKRILENIMDNFFHVHMRYATKGAITDQNAHPFSLKYLVGMHNGTLKDLKYQSTKKTDSELLFMDINQRGLDPVLQELDKDSAYALVIFDKRTGKTHFIRNKDRTLYYCYNKNRAVMYYASEARMLAFVADRWKLNISEIYDFEPGKLYSLDPRDVHYGNRAPTMSVRDVFPEGELPLPAPTNNIRVIDNRSVVEEKVGNVVSLSARPILPMGGRSLVEQAKAIRPPIKSGPNRTVLSGSLNGNGVPIIPRKLPPLAKCIYCTKELSLLEQHKALKVEQEDGKPTLFSCSGCEDTIAQVNITTSSRILN